MLRSFTASTLIWVALIAAVLNERDVALGALVLMIGLGAWVILDPNPVPSRLIGIARSTWLAFAGGYHRAWLAWHHEAELAKWLTNHRSRDHTSRRIAHHAMRLVELSLHRADLIVQTSRRGAA